MVSPEYVYGLHEFVAENADEVSFKVGEAIKVVEKDDAYSDGWWQGTNSAGETGLFPFSYTTVDRDLAMNAKALGMGAGEGAPAAAAASAAGAGAGIGASTIGGTGATPAPSTAAASKSPGMMNTTMADVDQALTEIRTASGTTIPGTATKSRRSFESGREAESGDEEGSDAGEYQSRANARAALAANAQADLASQAERERLEQERMRAQAQKMFQAEEDRQREMLLEKEAERQSAANKGEIKLSSDNRGKAAPIAGVDMSDESDSEGSAAGLDEYGNQEQGPLTPSRQRFPSAIRRAASGNLVVKPMNRVAEEETNKQQLRRDFSQDELEDVSAANGAALAPGADGGSASNATYSPKSSSQRFAGSSIPPVAAAAAAMGHRRNAPVESGSAGRFDQRSIDSGVRAEGGSIGGTGTHTAATSLGGAPSTPKSVHAAFAPSTPVSTGHGVTAASPAPSIRTRGTAGPGGDPHDWSVEQVVEWARSKNWDEAAVVSKFAEHEISGDVLLEMDINILKEIDITAFGKRFQVANAIKELKGAGSGPVAGFAMASPASGGPPSRTQTPSFTRADSGSFARESYIGGGHSNNGSIYQDAQPAAAASAFAASAAGAHFDGSGPGSSPRQDAFESSIPPPGRLGSPIQTPSYPTSSAAPRSREVSREAPLPPQMPSSSTDSGYTGQEGSGFGTSSTSSTSNTGGKSLSAMADEAMAQMRARQASGGATLGTAPGSPRRREVSGPKTGPASAPADRSSFFNKIRKSGGAGEDEKRSSGGTLSKLGFNRTSRGSGISQGGDIKNQISLPTTSPTYEAQNESGRAKRDSQMASENPSGGQSFAAGGVALATSNGQNRPASIGSAGPGAEPRKSTSAPPPMEGEGPVMSRIRPVDIEGWMKKKGERYNTWKPRYLALKGSDLVILRDPDATKIKGYISMKGYKVIADENTNPGKYGFKILHESEKPHYFSSDDPLLVRDWMKGLMKATIGRDHSFPVISSYNNATISLKEAQKMNPPPRPPSPTSRARAQRAQVRENTDQLTSKDAAVLMGMNQQSG